MTAEHKLGLRPAKPQAVQDSLSFALRYAGRKRVHHADDAMARITAERLIQHLERSGYVLVKRPECAASSTSGTAARTPPTEPGAMAAYTELQVCSNYSFLRGASRIDELMLQAKALGYDALAITITTASPASPAPTLGPRR